MKGLRLIQELIDISGNKAKEDFIVLNLDNKEFVEIMKFVLDDNIITGIDIKKWNKVNPDNLDEYNKYASSLTELFGFIKKNNTGRERDISGIKAVVNFYFTGVFNDIMSKIMTKTLKTGVTKKTWNKIVTDEYKIDVVPYMGCKAYSEKLVDKLFEKNEYVLSQVKEDGAFLNYVDGAKDNIPKTISRNGKIQNYGVNNILCDMSMSGLFVGYVVMGEVLIEGEPDRARANGILRQLDYYYSNRNNLSDKKLKDLLTKFDNEFKCTPAYMVERIIYKVWDIVPVREFNKGIYNKPYIERWQELKTLVWGFDSPNLQLVKTEICRNKDGAMIHLSGCLKDGLEGTVLKSPSGIFKDGKPDWQIKMKVEFTLDLEIIGYKDGKIGTKNEGTIGSIICQSSDGILKCSPNGFDEKTQEMINNNRDSFISKIVEVKCNGLSQNKLGEKSVLYPKFVQLRDDKDVANTYQECVEIQNSALGLRKELD